MLPRPFSTFQVLSAVVAVAPAADPVEWPLSVGRQNDLDGPPEQPWFATRTTFLGKQNNIDGQPEQPQWVSIFLSNTHGPQHLLELVSAIWLCPLAAIHLSFEHCQDAGHRNVYAIIHY